MKVTGFGIANYRSFCGEGSFVHDFGKINVFIGKNNSGKSNILRFLQYVAKLNPQSPSSGLDQSRKTTDPILLGLAVNLEIEQQLKSYAMLDQTASIPNPLELWTDIKRNQAVGQKNPLEPFRNSWIEKVHDELTNSRYGGYPDRKRLLNDTLNAIVNWAAYKFRETIQKLIYVPAIREIRTTDSEAPEGMIDLSGQNLVKTLRKMQHPAVGKEAERELFHRIGEVLKDLLGVKDIEMEIPADSDDIYLTVHDTRLPLAYYGTGVHELVILCSTLMLHDNHVVCIEEPEIHLHPELLRKFLRFLATTNNTYFIATHSNALLDADETTAVYHVQNDGVSSKITKSRTNSHTRAILRDLRYRASDLLQTNGIIWVEGPSDRIYINRWLALSGSEFVEGVHYSIMFYGGACLANISACDHEPGDEFVELLRINSNVIVVIDRDGDSVDTPLRTYKQRVLEEVGTDRCWVTQGREIENYLPSSLLKRFLSQRIPEWTGSVTFGQDEKIDDCIKAAIPSDNSFTYERNKKGYAKEICDVMTSEDIDHLNLKEWVGNIRSAIEKWNEG